MGYTPWTPCPPKLKHTIHNATAVCPKENAEAYTFLLRSSLRFKPMEAVLNNESYHASSKAARARVHPSQPCVLKPNTDGVYRISSSSPFNSLRLTIFHHIFSVKLLKHFDVFRAGRAMIREGGSTSRDLSTSASYIVGYVSCDACFQTRISKRCPCCNSCPGDHMTERGSAGLRSV